MSVVKSCVVGFAVIALVGGCSPYWELRINEQTGFYGSAEKLKPGIIQAIDTNFDLDAYKFVYVDIESGYYVDRLDFSVRHVLMDIGFPYVMNGGELIKFIKDTEKLSDINSITDRLTLSRLSEKAGPILRVRFSAFNAGSSGKASVAITDLSSGTLLLKAEYSTLIWANYFSELLYPVFNAMKKWSDDSRQVREGEAI